MFLPRLHSWRYAIRGLLVLAAAALAQTARSAAPQFEVTFDKGIRDTPYTGRVYIVTTPDSDRSPLEGVNWFDPQPFFAQDVENWAPGELLRFDPDKCLGYPDDLAKLPAGSYRLQAVLDLDGRSHDVIKAPGNGTSAVVQLEHDPNEPATVSLRIDRTLPPLHLADTEDLKYARLLSDRLSQFHGRYVHMYAAVGLPQSYADHPDRRYPAVYVVSGFGGTICDTHNVQMTRVMLENVGFDAFVIYIDADCPTGHHVFADSANNGPWGTALVRELIPYLEKRFRLIPEPAGRYVTGVSSGGWSSLWLQVTYPDTFGGVWSISPDPVDFAAFQIVNIYDPNENFLFDAAGQPREFSRGGIFGKPIIMRDFCRMEEVLGRGGQMQSFDAVFSPRGPDGKPLPLWDRRTGRIDPQVAEAWKKYDIRLIVGTSWKTLGPRLAGKLHLFCGDQDDFFLERAFFKLRDALTRLGSDADIEVVPEGGHGLSPGLWLRTIQQMKAQFEARPATELTSRLPGVRVTRAVGVRAVAARGDREDTVHDPIQDRCDPGLKRARGGVPEFARDSVVTADAERHR
jgi:S-formylglutathione hydrolase FrmB